MVTPDGQSVSHAARLDFATTNNASKYEALLLGLRKAKTLGAKRIVVKSDSHLIAGHFDKSFMVRDPEMARYLTMVRTAGKHFLSITIQATTRGGNEAVDRLAKLSSSGKRPPPEVFYEILMELSAASKAQGVAAEAQGAACLVLEIAEVDWRDTTRKYLTSEDPEDTIEANCICHRARNYHIISGQLYKGGICPPFL